MVLLACDVSLEKKRYRQPHTARRAEFGRSAWPSLRRATFILQATRTAHSDIIVAPYIATDVGSTRLKLCIHLSPSFLLDVSTLRRCPTYACMQCSSFIDTFHMDASIDMTHMLHHMNAMDALPMLRRSTPHNGSTMPHQDYNEASGCAACMPYMSRKFH